MDNEILHYLKQSFILYGVDVTGTSLSLLSRDLLSPYDEGWAAEGVWSMAAAPNIFCLKPFYAFFC